MSIKRFIAVGAPPPLGVVDGHVLARLLLLLLVAATVPLGAAQDSPPAITEEVAFVGDPAPGIPEFVFSYLTQPRIDGEGNVIFMAYVYGPGVHSGNDTAIFYGQPGNLQKLIWAGEQAPEMAPGVVISDLMWSGEHLSESGWVSFAAFVSGPGIEPDFNDRVLYVGPPDDLQKVIQAGDQAIGCEPGAYYGSQWFGGKLSDNNTLKAGSVLGGTGGSDQGIWIGTRDSLELVYRDGMHVPYFPSGVHFAQGSGFVHNDAGQIAFRGQIAGPEIYVFNNDGRWMGGPGTLIPTIREGDPVPSIGEGVTFDLAPGSSSTAINSLGESAEGVVVEGEGITEDNNWAFFFVTEDGELELLSREGDPVPDAGEGVYVDYMGNPRINNKGELYYVMKYKGPGTTEDNDAGLHFGPPGAMTQVLRDQDPAPSFPSEITIRRLGFASGSEAMNDIGDFVVPSQIQGPDVTDDNNLVLWLRHHIIRRCVPLLRSGDIISDRVVYAEDENDFSEGYWHKTGGADGQYQSFNDLGMLAMRILFTDGTHGVYRISPPAFGDADQDQDTDIEDWLALLGCYAGPDGDVEQDCEVFDLDADGDVDMVDQSMFQQLFTG